MNNIFHIQVDFAASDVIGPWRTRKEHARGPSSRSRQNSPVWDSLDPLIIYWSIIMEHHAEI